MSNKNAARKLVLAFTIGLPVVMGFDLAIQRRAAVVLGHYLHNRAGECSLAASFQSERFQARQAANEAALRKTSTPLESDPRGFVRWQTRDGPFWLPAGSQGEMFQDLAEQERDIYSDGPATVRPGDIVLDCGANIGVYTRTALRAGAKLVVAIEPAPENLECLRRNFPNEIAAGRVVLYPKGVWNRDDVLRMNIDPANSAGDSFVKKVGDGRTVDLPLTTIDKLAQELKLPRVDFIKMDIEGAEQKAIAGARETIAKYRPRMALCVYHLPADPAMVPKLVRETGVEYHTKVKCLCALDKIYPQVELFY